MNFIQFAISCLMVAGPLVAHAGNDADIPSGHAVIKDARIWSCNELTQEEKDEVAERRIEVSLMGSSPERSCLIRDENGEPTLLRRRKVEPGSTLLTYDEQSETYLKQTWSARFIGIKRFSDGKGSAIDLPQILVAHEGETWKGSPEGPGLALATENTKQP